MNAAKACAGPLLLGLAPALMAQGPVPDLPSQPLQYANPTLPNHFLIDPPGPPTSVVGQDNVPGFNPVTDAGATLGRVLFYDKLLSANGTVSCSSCHDQSHGFTDPNVLSPGFDGGFTRRHSMGLSNARYYGPGSFFWDQRAATLEQQVLMPIQDTVEMGLTVPEMIERIEEREFYEDLYTAAFGDGEVTANRTSRALAQFVRSLQSYQSRYDTGIAQVGNPGQAFPNFTASENLGKQLFFQPPPQGAGCAGCHATDAQIQGPGAPMNTGLDAQSTTDLGVFETTGNPAHMGAFKVGSLRNIAEGAPYMHDGRFATLAEVVEFYNNGVQNHPNLDPRLRGPGGQPQNLGLNAAERAALVDFMETLSDPTFLTDPKFSDPFPDAMGTTYCDPAERNSTGHYATMHAEGLPFASANDLRLHAVSLPANQFAMFIAGPSQDFVMNPGGSAGNLCVGANGTYGLGRIVTSLQSTGELGVISHELDVTAIPIPTAPYTVSMAPGMTWNFQTWYRDNGGANNFSNAVGLTFF